MLTAVVDCKIATSARTAKDTAIGAGAAVPVGAAESGVDGYFLTLLTIGIFAVGIDRVIGFAMPVCLIKVTLHYF